MIRRIRTLCARVRCRTGQENFEPEQCWSRLDDLTYFENILTLQSNCIGSCGILGPIQAGFTLEYRQKRFLKSDG